MIQDKMTSRERVLKTLNFEIPDRVPIDMGGFQTGIHRDAYIELIRHLGLTEAIAILDPVQMLAKPSEAVLERLRVDVRYIVAHGPDSFKGGIERNTREGRVWLDLRDEFGVVWSTLEDQQLYMDITHHPLAGATIKDIKDYAFPAGNDPTRFTGLRERALELRRNTPYALSTGIGGVVYETCWYMRGLERWLMDTMVDPEFCGALLDQILKFWLGYYTAFMAEIGDLIDVVMVGDDLAGQTGPIFSPSFYREFVKPRQKQLVQHIKTLTRAKIWYHTCGACQEYIPDLADNGVDILNPVQISATDMAPEYLKEAFGKKMAFWGGGIDSQHVLPRATPAEVREHVRRNIEVFKRGGGYIFNSVHNIQRGVPPENVLALFDAAYEFGSYD